MTDKIRRLPLDQANNFLLDSISEAHSRTPFVGGLFNAYEPAVHYELYNAALVAGYFETLQEAPLGTGQTSCELVFPLSNGENFWVEVKQWWFLNTLGYQNQTKTKYWPMADWDRLSDVGGQRALLLLRTWDDLAGRSKADQWLDDLRRMMATVGAPLSPKPRSLNSFAYPGPIAHTRSGDAILWSSAPM